MGIAPFLFPEVIVKAIREKERKMDIDKESVSHHAEQLKNQASELVAKVDINKAAGWTSAFMKKVFFFGKIVAALFMFLCIATMAFSLLYYVFSGASGVKVPDFDEVREALASEEGMRNDNSGDMKSLKETNAVRKEFDSEITKLMELCALPKEAYERYVRKLARMKKEMREDYIDGALDFAKAAKKNCERKDSKDKFDGETVVGWYDGLFESALETAEADVVKTRIKKTMALSICGGALIGLVLFLIIPLLIQIEENTRK